MSIYSGSPPAHPVREPFLGTLKSFLPLSEEGISARRPPQPTLIARHTATASEFQHQRLARKPSAASSKDWNGRLGDDEESVISPRKRLASVASDLMNTPQMRSLRLIGNNNPRHQWEKYYKKPEQLKPMKKELRRYYERNNFLISQYLYIDRLLDSSIPHSLIQEYHQHPGQQASVSIPRTISEEPNGQSAAPNPSLASSTPLVKRTPKSIYHIPETDGESTPLLGSNGLEDGPTARDIEAGEDAAVEGNAPAVTFAIYLNFAANTVLLAGKIVVMVLTSSLSVLASLVDAALDFLSTFIVWTTTQLIQRQDAYRYPVGRRRLEPIGVLVFSVVMITSFLQVALECFSRLTNGDHSVVQLTVPAIIIMASTVLVKFGCWLWCRLIKNTSVQALAQDAVTDVVFNIFSIIFPLVGYYLDVWYLDALGGLFLSIYVMFQWSRITATHVANLSGAAASADDRNILLYLTMRFAQPITHIQGLQAYHAGDKLNVEVDIVLDESMRLRDSHDLGESLQYVLESVPCVDRAFVHMDYRTDNIPGHLAQQE